MVKAAKLKIEPAESLSGPAARPRPSPFVVSRSPDSPRHRRKCSVCRHPDRAAIEEEFLHWRSPASISRIFKIEERAVYRHARAFQLDKRRRRHLRFSLGHILEQVHTVKVTPNLILRGVKAFTRATDEGPRVEPHRARRSPGLSAAASAVPAAESRALIDSPNRTERAVTCRNQSCRNASNRQENTQL